VTFNQISREFPCGGMNEAGLVVEVMVVLTPSKAKPDMRPVITTLQWIQYQLDNYATVAEVVAHASDLCIREQASVPLHYLVGDETGAAATIEVFRGKVVCHTGADLPVKVLTNDNYRRSYYAMRRFQNFNGDQPEPLDRGSLIRFIRASRRVEEFTPRSVPEAVDYAFETLHIAFMADRTKWTIVYDIAGRRIYFRTYTRPDIRYVDLGPLDFSCRTPVQMMDINKRAAGDVTGKFMNYTSEANRELVGKAFDVFWFLRRHRDKALDILSNYPDTTVCAE
jgi:choloylglycine hydrolase